MRFDVKWVDVRPYLVSGVAPVVNVVIPTGRIGADDAAVRGTAGEVWVVDGHLLGEARPPYAPVTAGDGVRIPVAAYRTRSASHAELFGLGVQIGLAAAAGLRHHTPRPIDLIHLVLGSHVDDLTAAGEPAIRAYVGVAIRTG